MKIKKKQQEEKKESLKEKIKKNFINVNDKNYDFLNTISSQSGFAWHEHYYLNVNKHHACLHAVDFMFESYPNFMDEVIKLPYAFVTLDNQTLPKKEYKSKFDNLIKKTGEVAETNSSASGYMDSLDTAQQLSLFHQQLNNEGNKPKEGTLRIYVLGDDGAELIKRINAISEILDDLEMQAVIQPNNLPSDVKAITSFSNPYKKLMSSSTVADFMQRSIVNLIDDNVPIIGYTKNGIMAPNIYSFRYSAYDLLIIGGRGAGKSGLMKLLSEGYYLKDLVEGRFVVHILDSHEEYDDFAEVLGIESVVINKDNNVNIMQIFFTEDANGVISEVDVVNKVTELVSHYDNFTEYGSKQTLDVLTKFFKKEYEGYIGRNKNDYSNEDWLTLSTPLAHVNRLIEGKEKVKIPDEEKSYYSNIKLGLEKLVDTYGFMFDRTTNMDFDLTKSLRFDISYINKNKDNQIKSGYVALIQNYLSQAMGINLKRNDDYLKSIGKYMFEFKEPIYKYLMVFEETMSIASKILFENCSRMMKIGRKSYSACAYLIHSDADTKTDMDRFGNEIKEMIQLCPNKFIGILDGESIASMKESGILSMISDEDVKIVQSFVKGDNDERPFLYINDLKEKYYFHSVITDEQRKYYKGGN